MDKKNNEINYCCSTMGYYLNPETKDVLIEYDLSIRKYYFVLHYKGKRSIEKQPALYCPWCGTELPKTLGEEWDELLEQEYGLTTNDFWDKNGKWDESKIPPEFRTDEWWKKRGL